MSIVILQDEMVHYEVLGRGRPLLFLHGWVGSWRYWIPTMQAASMAYRAYAIDLWGFGDTAHTPDRYPLDQQCSLIESFLDKMGIPRAVLIGHGLGAAVALQFAYHHPDLVDRVMAVGLPLDGAAVHPRLRTGSPGELADWLLGKQPAMEAARAEAPRADALAIRTTLDNLQDLKLPDLMGQLLTPCLFVQGGSDPILAAPRPSNLLGAAAQNGTGPLEEPASLPESSHQILFEGSGHFPMLDETSKFNRLLVDFLALASGESPKQLQLKEEWKRRVR
jgi:pimeloyl-ACP methyl ester carboxylesterase